MTYQVRTVPKTDGHIGYDDVGYYLIPPFGFRTHETREARDVRARVVPRYQVLARVQPRYRVTAEVLPRR